jgi:hypothetical protein
MAGAKAHLYYEQFAARLKSCPDTMHSPKIILQVAQKVFWARRKHGDLEIPDDGSHQCVFVMHISDETA